MKHAEFDKISSRAHDVCRHNLEARGHMFGCLTSASLAIEQATRYRDYVFNEEESKKFDDRMFKIIFLLNKIVTDIRHDCYDEGDEIARTLEDMMLRVAKLEGWDDKESSPR